MQIIALTARTIIGFIELIIIKILIEKNEYEELDKYTNIVLLVIIGASILNYKDDILIYIVPIITILILRKIVLYNKKVKNIFEKDPILIIKNSKIIYRNLFKSNYNLERLIKELKEKDIYSLKELKYVFLNNNELFIIKYKEKINKTTEVIILDNKINKENLEKVGVSEKYIKGILSKENIKLKDIAYGVYKNNKIYIIRNSLLK